MANGASKWSNFETSKWGRSASDARSEFSLDMVVKMDEEIYVTRPFLPAIGELIPFLEEIWSKKILTNRGPLHERLRAALKRRWSLASLSLLNNGDSALYAALNAFDTRGSVITTPFSFVSTSHSILRAGLTPIFADISEEDFNLSPNAVEAAIRPDTTAILAVHVYGKPCDVDGLEAVARRNGLRLLYDAAHAFGVRHRGRSILQYGDASILSFHATKVFNTFEGGAVASPHASVEECVDRYSNFGIEDEESIPLVGFNGKLNEFQAAAGLVQLQHLDEMIARRKAVSNWYRRELAAFSGVRVPDVGASTDYNYAYFPILIEGGGAGARDLIKEEMGTYGVFPRKYFYPLISNTGPYRGLPSAVQENLPVANAVAAKVLCLPLHQDLSASNITRVMEVFAAAYCKYCN